MAGVLTATGAIIAGDVTSSNYSDVPVYAGYKLEYSTGNAYFNNVNIRGGVIDGTSTIGGRTASTLASAIDASGHFADSAISTATSTIITPFTFGVSGALQIGTYVNGVSGDVRISPSGILGRDINGATTFSINGTTGVAVLNGLVVGTNVGQGTAVTSSGVTTIIGDTVTTSFVNALNVTAQYVAASISITSPTITSGSIYSGLFSTSTSGATAERVEMGVSVGGNIHNICKYDASNNKILEIGINEAIVISSPAARDKTCILLTQAANRPCIDANKTGVGAGNVIDISNEGTGYDIGGSNDNWYCEKDGTGNFKFLSLVKTNTSIITDPLLYITSDYESASATCVDISNTGGATVTSPMVTMSGDIRGSLLYINATETSTSSNVRVASVGDLPNIEIIKTTNSGIGMKIGMTSNDANQSYGLEFNLANDGAGVEHAFKFSGSEYIASATGVSGLTGVVKVSTSDGTVYLPVYSSYT